MHSSISAKILLKQRKMKSKLSTKPHSISFSEHLNPLSFSRLEEEISPLKVRLGRVYKTFLCKEQDLIGQGSCWEIRKKKIKQDKEDSSNSEDSDVNSVVQKELGEEKLHVHTDNKLVRSLVGEINRVNENNKDLKTRCDIICKTAREMQNSIQECNFLKYQKKESIILTALQNRDRKIRNPLNKLIRNKRKLSKFMKYAYRFDDGKISESLETINKIDMKDPRFGDDEKIAKKMFKIMMDDEKGNLSFENIITTSDHPAYETMGNLEQKRNTRNSHRIKHVPTQREVIDFAKKGFRKDFPTLNSAVHGKSIDLSTISYIESGKDAELQKQSIQSKEYLKERIHQQISKFKEILAQKESPEINKSCSNSRDFKESPLADPIIRNLLNNIAIPKINHNKFTKNNENQKNRLGNLISKYKIKKPNAEESSSSSLNSSIGNVCNKYNFNIDDIKSSHCNKIYSEVKNYQQIKHYDKIYRPKKPRIIKLRDRKYNLDAEMKKCHNLYKEGKCSRNGFLLKKESDSTQTTNHQSNKETPEIDSNFRRINKSFNGNLPSIIKSHKIAEPNETRNTRNSLQIRENSTIDKTFATEPPMPLSINIRKSSPEANEQNTIPDTLHHPPAHEEANPQPKRPPNNKTLPTDIKNCEEATAEHIPNQKERGRNYINRQQVGLSSLSNSTNPQHLITKTSSVISLHHKTHSHSQSQSSKCSNIHNTHQSRFIHSRASIGNNILLPKRDLGRCRNDRSAVRGKLMQKCRNLNALIQNCDFSTGIWRIVVLRNKLVLSRI